MLPLLLTAMQADLRKVVSFIACISGPFRFLALSNRWENALEPVPELLLLLSWSEECKS